MALSNVRVNSVACDGNNYYLDISLFDGMTTEPNMYPVFPVGTTAATIRTYLQDIANNRPSLADDIVTLVGAVITES